MNTRIAVVTATLSLLLVAAVGLVSAEMTQQDRASESSEVYGDRAARNEGAGKDGDLKGGHRERGGPCGQEGQGPGEGAEGEGREHLEGQEGPRRSPARDEGEDREGPGEGKEGRERNKMPGKCHKHKDRGDGAGEGEPGERLPMERV